MLVLDSVQVPASSFWMDSEAPPEAIDCSSTPLPEPPSANVSPSVLLPPMLLLLLAIVTSPVPSFRSVRVPPAAKLFQALPTLMASLRLKASVAPASRSMLPLPIVPVMPPSPTSSVPAETVVVPE